MLLEPLLVSRVAFPLGVADPCNHGRGVICAHGCHEVTWCLYAEELVAARCAVTGCDDRADGASLDLAVNRG